jgi:YidC/Oxa1 family membrane protein insertase
MPPKDDNRNLFMFLIASMVLLFGYQFLVVDPAQKRAQALKAQTSASASLQSLGLPQTFDRVLSTKEALGLSPRIEVQSEAVSGSISLVGARIDDLRLLRYKETQNPNSPAVTLFEPLGTKYAYYGEQRYFAQNLNNMPGPDTQWRLVTGKVLTPKTPVVLEHDNGAGILFRRTVTLDNDYLFSITDQVINSTSAAISLQTSASIVRTGLPKKPSDPAVHAGPIATWSRLKDGAPDSGHITHEIKYNDLVKKGKKEQDTKGGWAGITDTYWLASVIPDQNQSVSMTLESVTDKQKVPTFRSGYLSEAITIAPGKSYEVKSRLYAGAKKNSLLKAYEVNQQIPRFDAAIDWGMLSFLTQPMNFVLEWFYKFFKNFGLAILALTVVVKIVFYPLAHSSYESMMKFKAVQQHLAPKLEAIKKRNPNDLQKQQQETMELYQREKINPMAPLGGCLPMLLQIPVFFALYKVLLISLDMRHAPFFGFITDLSAKDPTSIINLFGLLPFDPAAVPMIGGFLAGPLHIGIVAILYGLSMWLSQHMTPMTGVDEMQKKIFQFMPLVFTFVMAPFAIGLLVYWVWSNILTMIQQYTIMRRLKVDNIIDETIAKLMKRPYPKSSS